MLFYFSAIYFFSTLIDTIIVKNSWLRKNLAKLLLLKMKKLAFFICIILCFDVYLVNAQDLRSSQFDILNYNISLTIRNLQNKTIKGNSAVKLKSQKNNLTTVQLDLVALSVDSIVMNQNKLSFTQNDSQVIVTLNAPAQLNDTLSFSIYYGGTPISDPSWGGFYFSGNYAFNMGVGFTVNPHNFGRAWFPCVDNFTERSTFHFSITTDSGFMAICNGLPQPVQINSDNSLTWNWTLNQPIPTYLASVAVSTYTPIKYSFKGKSKNFDVIIAAQPKDTTKAKASMVNLDKALSFFENSFTSYPFDRIGYTMVPFNGGAMEHATCITYPLFGIDGTLNYETLMAHELSHMWWGNMVTCENAKEMWLNEGWASFCEALFLEFMYGKSAYFNDMNEKLMEVLRSAHLNDGGFLVLNNIPHEVTYGTHVYKKGALTAAALRYYMGDSAFFKACNSYLTNNQFKSSNSNVLKNEFQKFTSVNLTSFFNDWVYSPGNAALIASSYTVMPGNAHNFIQINLRQHSRGNNITYANIPLKITLFDKNGNKFIHQDSINTYEKQITVIVPYDFNTEFLIVNENNELPLARTYNLETLKGTGLKNLSNALLSVNILQNTDSAIVLAEHYWVPATQYEVEPTNIRISNYRFWNIDGYFDENKLKAQLYLSYDGTTPTNKNNGYLDNLLPFSNEDSLVLLYKAPGTNKWILHTDNTKFTGGSKTDKIGRFTTNNIKKGMYAIGVKDYKVGIKPVKDDDLGFMVYPNPSKQNFITVKINDKIRSNEMVVYDKTGKEILKTQITDNQIVVNTENWVKGLYYVRIGKYTQPFILE
jgi:aminopeptidase N